MTRKEVVSRAIHFNTPGRIPKFFFNQDKRSDVIMVVCEDWALGENNDETEWGFSWNITKGDAAPMGTPKFNAIEDWNQLDDYLANKLPDPRRADRFRRLDELEVPIEDRYLLASTFLSGFTVMMMLRGFENIMMDMYDYPDELNRLAEAVFGVENEIIREMAKRDFNAVALFDDWGTQSSMMISPEAWREFYFPHYKKQFDLAHSLGMDVFFHTCGVVYPIIGDLIEAGVDIMNLGQLELNDPEKLKEKYKGKVCFCQPINYQQNGLFGSREDILAEGREIYDLFGDPRGGLIAEVFDYDKMGWGAKGPKQTVYQIEAFEQF